MTDSFHFNLFCIFVCLLQSLPSIHLAQKAPFTDWGMLQETDFIVEDFLSFSFHYLNATAGLKDSPVYG